MARNQFFLTAFNYNYTKFHTFITKCIIPQKFSAKLLHYKGWPLTLQKLVKVKFHEDGVPLLIFRMVLMLPCQNIQLQENSKVLKKTSELLQNMFEHFQTQCVACEANFPFEIFLCNVLFHCKMCHSSTQSRTKYRSLG